MAVDDRGPELLRVAWSFLILTSLVTLLRIYCRAWEVRCFWIGDWLAAAAQVFFAVCLTSEITSVKYGAGRHVADIPPHDYPTAVRHLWICDVSYIIANICIKASIAALLLRICLSRAHRLIVYINLSVTVLYCVIFVLLFILQCRPTSMFWEKFLIKDPPEGSCLDPSVTSKGFYGYSAISCVTDWSFSLLPMRLIWHLRLSFRDKTFILIILAAGLIASTATIVRIRYLHALADVKDFLYTQTDVAIWSDIETGLAIIISATATLQPLVRKWFGEDLSDGRDDRHDRHEIPSTRRHPYQKAGSCWETNHDGVVLCDYSRRGIGVTTVINHIDGERKQDDIEAQVHRDVNCTPDSGRVRDEGTIRRSDMAPTRPSRAWITVTKSVAQSTDPG